MFVLLIQAQTGFIFLFIFLFFYFPPHKHTHRCLSLSLSLSHRNPLSWKTHFWPLKVEPNGHEVWKANMCPKPCACHMTSQAHLTTVKTNSLSLFTNTRKTKPFQSYISRVSRSAELVASKQPASRLDYNRNGY